MAAVSLATQGGYIALSLIVVKSFQEEKKSLFDRNDFKLDVSAYKLFFRWLANNSKGIFGPHPTLGTMLHFLKRASVRMV
jgi:hypothetical protein